MITRSRTMRIQPRRSRRSSWIFIISRRIRSTTRFWTYLGESPEHRIQKREGDLEGIKRVLLRCGRTKKVWHGLESGQSLRGFCHPELPFSNLPETAAKATLPHTNTATQRLVIQRVYHVTATFLHREGLRSKPPRCFLFLSPVE